MLLVFDAQTIEIACASDRRPKCRVLHRNRRSSGGSLVQQSRRIYPGRCSLSFSAAALQVFVERRARVPQFRWSRERCRHLYSRYFDSPNVDLNFVRFFLGSRLSMAVGRLPFPTDIGREPKRPNFWSEITV